MKCAFIHLGCSNKTPQTELLTTTVILFSPFGGASLRVGAQCGQVRAPKPPFGSWTSHCRSTWQRGLGSLLDPDRGLGGRHMNGTVGWGWGHKHSGHSMMHLDYVSGKNEPEQDIRLNGKKKKKKASCRTSPTPLNTQPYVSREGMGKAGAVRAQGGGPCAKGRLRWEQGGRRQASSVWLAAVGLWILLGIRQGTTWEPGRDKIRFTFLTSDSRCHIENRHRGIRREGTEADKKELLSLL